VKLLAPGRGALASAGAFGAGIGDVVEVCACAPVATKAQKIDVRTTFRIIISLWKNGISSAANKTGGGRTSSRKTENAAGAVR
jgi:hypothetical protein